MDGVSVAASVVAIATVGVQVSIKLITLATQISTASERITSIGNDVSLTSGILHQLGELMNQKITAHGISIFSQGGLETTRTSAAMCEKIFQEIEKEARKASAQIKGTKMPKGGKIELSRMGKAKWPFLQPNIDILRTDLREAKGTLMLMLQVTSLAPSKKMADLNSSASISIMEQQNAVRAIIALQQQQTTGDGQEGQAKDPLVRNLEEADKSSPGGTSHNLTSMSSNQDMSTSFTQNNPRTRSPTSQERVKQSWRQNLDSEVDAIDDTPKNIELPTSCAAIGPSDATNMDTSQQSPLWEHNSEAFDGANLSQQQTLKRKLTPVSTERNEDTHQVPFDPSPSSQVKASSNSSTSTSKNDSPDLRMFLVRPSVRDHEETVQILWTATDANMQQSEIHKQLVLYEHESLPSVLDQLETLHTYERSHIDRNLRHGSFTTNESRYELVALKRTWTSIHHREMFFSSLPGLHFVVQKVIGPRPRTPETIQYPIGEQHRIPRPRARRPPYLTPDQKTKLRWESVPEEAEMEYEVCALERVHHQSPRSSKSFYISDSEEDITMRRCWEVSSEEAEEAPAPEKEPTEDMDEEQVVAELLGKYTTLYD